VIKGEGSSNFVGGVHPEGIHPDFVPRAQSEGRAPSPAKGERESLLKFLDKIA
jgi:hypothetical protein